jgi:hypothetical protein
MTGPDVKALRELLDDLRRDGKAPRFAGCLEIRSANLLRDHGEELLRVYEAWQAAAEVVIGGADGLSCFISKPGKKPLPAMQGQRVKLVPVEGVAK